jgi:hypothetical protein
LRHLRWLYQFPFFALAPTEALGREVSIVAISETVLVLAGGTAVLSILFGMRVAMRVLAGGAASPRSDGGQAAGESGTPDVAGVIALPPLIVLGFLAAAGVLEAIVPLAVSVTHSLARYAAGAMLAAGGFSIIAMGTQAPTSRRPCRRRLWWSTASIGEPGTRSTWE